MKHRGVILRIEANYLEIVLNSKGGKVVHREPLDPPSAKPFLKWAGGKQWLAIAAPKIAPRDWKGRYFEPFLGGGAVFFSLAPRKAVISDKNEELIETYCTLRDNARRVVRLLRSYPYDRDFYYKMRQRVPKTPHAKAARFIYLNRTCWNGLYRVSRQGRFNTPFGRYNNPTICDTNRLMTAAGLLRRARLLTADFEKLASQAKPGDFVYLDPPYITGHTGDAFLKYNSRLFTWEDQERLSVVAASLSNRGVWVLISNANNPKVLSLFKGFHYYQVRRKSLIGGIGSMRGEIMEALLSNYPLIGITSEEM